jgi:hypothetical protein
LCISNGCGGDGGIEVRGEEDAIDMNAVGATMIYSKVWWGLVSGPSMALTGAPFLVWGQRITLEPYRAHERPNPPIDSFS